MYIWFFWILLADLVFIVRVFEEICLLFLYSSFFCIFFVITTHACPVRVMSTHHMPLLGCNRAPWAITLSFYFHGRLWRLSLMGISGIICFPTFEADSQKLKIKLVSAAYLLLGFKSFLVVLVVVVPFWGLISCFSLTLSYGSPMLDIEKEIYKIKKKGKKILTFKLYL